MSTATYDEREDKLRRLVRPLDWALRIGIYSCVGTFGMWYGQMIEMNETSLALLSLFTLVNIMLGFGLRRVEDAARGRI